MFRLSFRARKSIGVVDGRVLIKENFNYDGKEVVEKDGGKHRNVFGGSQSRFRLQWKVSSEVTLWK